MPSIAPLRCRCGDVEGRVENASPDAVNRVVCYCDDCQAYLHHLQRADLLDAHGGTDVVQVAPATVSFSRGRDRLRGLRLTPKGLYRFYTACCSTPVGNSLSGTVPFVGINAASFAGEADARFGPPTGRILGKFAIGTPPEGSVRPDLRFLAGAAKKIAGWRFGGSAWPHPFFDRGTREPTVPMTVLTAAERERLRPLCGPKPA